MKHARKLASLLLALVMVFALATTAFAADTTYTITISNAQPGHTYEAYQIFAGDLAEKEEGKVLSNIVWGNGVTEAGKTALGDAAGKAESLTGKTEAEAMAFAKEVAKYLQSPTESTPGNNNYTISGLSAGYYLVKDKDNSLINADDFYTAYIMEVVGDVTATPKGDKPTLDKQIQHNDDGTDSWGVVGDNQIGDTVEFRTISTVPNTAGYTTYTYTISDTMSAGLTSNVQSAADVTIKVNDNADKMLDAKYYTVTANDNTFTIDVDILKAVADGVLKENDKLYAYYTGVLNKDAKVYDEDKQVNTAHLEYSNNPNNSADKGKTPGKKVYDWTFKMGINKVDGKDKPLTGAKFVLSKSNSINIADLACGEDGVPTVTTDLIGLVKTGDNEYRIALNGETGTVYYIEAGNPVIKGLDDNVTYYLYETKSPKGYNLLSKPVSFTITAMYNEDGSALLVNNPTVTIDQGELSKNLSANVVNQAGTILPSTGGMGTTVFYVLGAVLVLGAGVLLVTKKRMSRSEG